MFRRISGSSSITNIFFMSHSEHGKLDTDGGALADAAAHLHLPAVQVGAAFHQQQAQPGTRAAPHIATPMEGIE